MRRFLLVTFLAFLCPVVLSATCQFKKYAAYYLSLNDGDYLAEASGGSRIGECYIVPQAARGACDMYVKSAIIGRDGDRGWPKNTDNRGTGCVKAPDKPKRVSTCFYLRSEYSLTDQERASFCTDRGVPNAVAMSKHAVRNNACNLPSNPPTVTCTVGEPRCPCGASAPTPRQCPVRGSPVSMPAEVSLERVRRCRSSFIFCNGVIDNPDNRVFDRVSKKRQKKLFLSQVFKPPRENTKNLVLVVAGQQAEINLGLFRIPGFTRVSLSDESNSLTGQRDGYKRHFSRRVGRRNSAVDRNSLVQSILSTGYFSTSDTFVGLVFDARFNYEYSSTTKNSHEDAYYEYIKNRMGSVNNVYLAGHSRGGCLVMRLASRLTKDYPNARVIVHGYDPVCAHPSLLRSSEFGVGDPKHQNPLNSDYEVYTTEMKDRFPARNCLAIRNFLSGEKVILDTVRAFGHRGHAGSTLQEQSLQTPSGFPWYTQSFHNYGHNSIDTFLHTEARNHLVNTMQSLPCECGAS